MDMKPSGSEVHPTGSPHFAGEEWMMIHKGNALNSSLLGRIEFSEKFFSITQAMNYE